MENLKNYNKSVAMIFQRIQKLGTEISILGSYITTFWNQKTQSCEKEQK